MTRYLRSFLTRESAGQFMKVGVVGVFNTVTSFGLFNIFLAVGWSWFWAVAWAFAITTFLSYLLNRRWTFRLDGDVSGRETLHFYLVNLAAWGATEVILWVADTAWGPLSTAQANLAYVFSAIVILIPKFASYRDIVFRPALRLDQQSPAGSGQREEPVTPS